MVLKLCEVERVGSMDKSKIFDKIESLFKEETWGRIDPKDIGISKFKILEDLLNNVVSEGLFSEVADLCRAHLAEYSHSIISRYLLGIIAYQTNIIDDKIYLKNLIEVFHSNHRWAIVEHIAMKILEYGENRYALKELAISLERLSRSREAIPVWEELLKIDRFDSEVARKLSFAIMEEDPEKSTYYMKLSLEAYIKNKEFDEVSSMWSKIISNAWEDFPFFERVERMLIEAKRKDLAIEMLKSLFKKYREADLDQAIGILKHILEYSPEDVHARNDVVRLYRERFSVHTQLEQFIRISRLDSPRAPVMAAVKAFENFIIFDIGNYVEHRSWGMGKIMLMDSENIVVDFNDKLNHTMSIQMALSSLTPIAKEHIRARQLDDFDGLKKIFTEDIAEFFRILLHSYGGKILSAQIKKEIIPTYIEQSAWSKWWNKARTELRKDPMFGFDEPKTGDMFIREKPVTYLEELVDKFRREGSFSEKLDTAIEFINNIPAEEGRDAAKDCVLYFRDAAKLGSKTKLVLSYFALRSLSKFVDEKSLDLSPVFDDLSAFIRESADLPIVSMKITDYDNKKDFVGLISSMRKDWPKVFTEILFETPIRIHRYVFNMLIRAHAYKEINTYIERVTAGAKQFPEITLWVSKNIFTEEWNYEWLDYSKERLILSLFRLVHDIKRIETKGTRLKNAAQELITENECAIFTTIIAQSGMTIAGRVFALARASEIFTDGQLDRMLQIIRKQYPDFIAEEAAKSGVELDYEEEIIVTKNGFDRKTAEYNTMVNSEMGQLQKDLSATSDVASDLRENVEYNALMEKQGILKQSITRLDVELKKAKIIDFAQLDTSMVSVGTKVHLKSSSGDEIAYNILGPWDADYERGILSYRSPLARALLKKKVGDSVKVQDAIGEYKIVAIEKGDK
jgi:transcription elongation factor GreA